jgi:hypothetical protein
LLPPSSLLKIAHKPISAHVIMLSMSIVSLTLLKPPTLTSIALSAKKLTTVSYPSPIIKLMNVSIKSANPPKLPVLLRLPLTFTSTVLSLSSINISSNPKDLIQLLIKTDTNKIKNYGKKTINS